MIQKELFTAIFGVKNQRERERAWTERRTERRRHRHTHKEKQCIRERERERERQGKPEPEKERDKGSQSLQARNGASELHRVQSAVIRCSVSHVDAIPSTGGWPPYIWDAPCA